MELRQLAYYKSIVEHGSINAAAKDLHMSQPPLSYAVAQLENELSVKLFERSAKGIRLTPAGKVFYLHSQDILARANSAMREVSSLTERKTFRIGVTPTVVPVIAPFLCQLKTEGGNILLELHEGNTYHLKESLDDGTLDAAVIRTPISLQGCRFLNILDEPMAVIYPKRKKGPAAVSLKELSDQPLIIYRRYEALIQAAFDRQSLSFNMVCECDDARTAISLAGQGMAAAIVPLTIAGSQNGLPVSVIDEKELTTSILLAWHSGSPLLNALMEIIKNSRSGQPA